MTEPPAKDYQAMQEAEADKWYYDLGKLAEQVEINRRNSERSRHRILAVALVTMFALLVLSLYAWNQERDLQRARHQSEVTRYEGCVDYVATLSRFNAQQSALAEIETTQTINPILAKARIDAYLSAIVDPLPDCGEHP